MTEFERAIIEQLKEVNEHLKMMAFNGRVIEFPIDESKEIDVGFGYMLQDIKNELKNLNKKGE